MEPRYLPTPKLTGMPPDVFLKILGYSGWQSIFVLQKTCKNFRKFLMANKLVVPASMVRLRVDDKGIQFRLLTKLSKKILHSHNVRNDLFLEYVMMIMDHINHDLECFEVELLDADARENHLLLGILELYLKNRDQKLKVDFFGTNDINRLGPILSNLDETSIKSIRFANPEPIEENSSGEPSRPTTRSITRRQGDYRFLTLENVKNQGNKNIIAIGEELKITSQWKSAWNLSMKNVWIDESVLKYTHFEVVNGWFRTVTADEVFKMKEIMVNRRYSDGFTLKYHSFPDMNRLSEAFGEDAPWYFKTIVVKTVLTIFFEDDKIILMKVCMDSDIARGRIQD